MGLQDKRSRGSSLGLGPSLAINSRHNTGPTSLQHTYRKGQVPTIAVLLLLVSASIAHAGWFFMITPPNGGPSFPVGPYKDDAACADTLGSAIYSHPYACHLHPSAKNCRITGDGFAYPKGFPYPVSADEQIPGGACFEEESESYNLPRGWYFLFYTATDGSIEKCSKLNEFKKLARVVPGDEIPDYSDMRCPGAPCFSVGFDTACE